MLGLLQQESTVTSPLWVVSRDCFSFSAYGLILSIFLGVKSYEVSLETQTATVVADASLPYDTVLATIKKTGKTVNSGEADGTPMAV